MKTPEKIPSYYRPHLINLKRKRGVAYLMFRIIKEEKKILKHELFEKVNQRCWNIKNNNTLNATYRTLKYTGAIDDNNRIIPACEVWYVQDYFIGNIDEHFDNARVTVPPGDMPAQNQQIISPQQSQINFNQ